VDYTSGFHGQYASIGEFAMLRKNLTLTPHRANRKTRRLDRKSQKAKERLDKIEKKRQEIRDRVEEKNERISEKAVAIKSGPLKDKKIASNAQIEALQKRLGFLEVEHARTKIEVSSLRSEVEELEADIADDMDEEDNRRTLNDMMFSAAGRSALAGVKAITQALNVGDKVHNRGALALGAALDTVATSDVATETQKSWALVGSTILSGLAYFDAKEGLSSLMNQDQHQVLDEVTTATQPLLQRIAESLENIQSALREPNAIASSLEQMSSHVSGLKQAIAGEPTEKNKDALVPLMRELTTHIENVSESVS